MFHSSGPSIFTKQKVNKLDYHYYSPVSSGGSWANEEETRDASESEAMLTRGQRASASSSVRSTFCPDPSSSSSGKCDKVTTNAD
jgi:hypothetical protein